MSMEEKLKSKDHDGGIEEQREAIGEYEERFEPLYEDEQRGCVVASGTSSPSINVGISTKERLEPNGVASGSLNPSTHINKNSPKHKQISQRLGSKILWPSES